MIPGASTHYTNLAPKHYRFLVKAANNSGVWNSRLRQRTTRRIGSVPGFELPEPVQAAQQEFDHKLAEKLDAMADCMEPEGTLREQTPATSLEPLEQTIETYSSNELNVPIAGRFHALLTLCHTAENLTASLDNELKAFRECG